MIVIESIDGMQKQSDQWRAEGKRVGLVPTMGALHAGHLSLVEMALRRSEKVVVSIFVNPSQFAEGEDFEEYPRDLANDLSILRDFGQVTAVFVPSTKAMYPSAGVLTTVSVDQITNNLCGPFRPGHFEGVATIVARLLHICKPDEGYFGLKDIQQFSMIERLVEDLNIDTKIVGVPIVREPDGLALSSRNVYLSDEERRQAVVISMAIERAKDMLSRGETNPVAVEDAMREIIGNASLAKIQYAEVVSGSDLQRQQTLLAGQKVIAAAAVHFGETRLIDNTVVTVGG